jgi:phosphoribosylamine---glycine ligase
MRILVLGGGGREHALVWRLAQERIHQLWCAPGNAGTLALAHNLPVDPTDPEQALSTADQVDAELTIVGPEAPLAAGIVDRFQAAGRRILGPTRAAARLETSKVWAKQFLLRHGLSTARAEVAGDAHAARAALGRFGLPAVLKADGLAGGKGVFVLTHPPEVDAALELLFERRLLGAAADQVLVEECLSGPELSVLAWVDGEHLAVMPPARDYKRLLDGNHGPNTGGMGGYTRPPDATPELLERIERDILRPAVTAMAAEGTPYRGVLYAGLMLTSDGPKLVEFNCRLGDPEAQLILPLLQSGSSLSELACAVTEGGLDRLPVRWRPSVTCGVVLAAPGYPEQPRLGGAIHGLDRVGNGVLVFHAGTRKAPDGGGLVTAGGRVLALVAEAASLAAARATVYGQAADVHFEGRQLRTDIGRP